MADQTKKVSEFEVANSIAGSDRLLILSSPNTNPTVKTIPTDILIANIAVVGGYVTTAQLAANLSNYVTTTQLNTQISLSEANNAQYFAGLSVNNFVNTAQLSANLENYVLSNTLSSALSNYVTRPSLESNLANYVTTTGLAANVVKLDANNTLFLGGLPASAYVNSSAFDASLTNYVSTNSLIANLSNYQTTTGLAANVINLTSNNTLFVGQVPAINVVSDVMLQSNLANYVLLSNLYSAMATANANNAFFLGGIAANDYVTDSELSANLSIYVTQTYLANYLTNYQIPVNLSNVSTLTVGNTSVNTYLTASYVKISNTTSNITISIPNTTHVSATNYFLNANGSWAVAVNTGVAYNWTNTHTFTSTIVGTVNNANYISGNSVSDINTYASDKAANAYANAVSYVDGKNYVNTSQLTTNLASYVTITGLAANIAALSVNSTSYLGGNTAADLRLYSDQMAANAFANSVAYVDAKNYVNTSQLSSNLSGYVTTSQLSSNLSNYVNTSQLSSNLANYVTTSQLSSNLANYQTTAGFTANIASYLPTYTGVVNASSFTVGTNFIANSTVVKLANSTVNTQLTIPTAAEWSATNYFLHANGSWVQVTAGGGGGFPNGDSISVNNFVITGTFTANSSNGSAGQVLTTNGTGVYWSTVTGGGGGGGSVGVAGNLTIDANNNVSWDANAVQVAYLTLSNNATLLTPTNMSNSGVYMLYVIQDGTGGWTLDYDTGYLWGFGIYPVHTTTAGSVDIVSFSSNGSSMFGVAQYGFQ